MKNIKEEPSQFEKRWGSKIVKVGFTQIPNLLIRHQKKLNITKSEVRVLEYLLSFIRDDFTVSVSLEVLRRDLGMTRDTVHQAKKGLIAKGFLTMDSRKTVWRTNEYDLFLTRMKLAALADYEENNRIIYGPPILRPP